MDELKQLNARQLEKREKREKKKVRFSGDIAESDEEEEKPRRPLFPKAKKKVVEEFEGEENDIIASDPRVAALERAKKREAEKQEDDELLDDIEGAEEDFEGGEDDEEDVIEPFNLKKEREEGYFDADGNYVEYRVEKAISDAWLDSVQVDERFAEEAAAKAAFAEAPPEEITSSEIGQIKRRIANALNPGETVLAALKRMGGERRRPQGKKKGPLPKMDPELKKSFDQLTEDAMKLIDNGEIEVYSEKKETFEREAEGYEALSRIRSGPSKRGSDMFGDSDDENGEGDQPPAKQRKVTGGSQLVGPEGSDVGTIGNVTGGSSTGPSFSGEESGYVYDPNSGYYYNSEVGYYYDASSGLYCDASTGVWYRYAEESNSYVEVKGEEATEK